ncbi:MAG: ComEC/Rec2 family competence protein [bacterium]|nr:ComEC/Rec2 family competence protein [bacterium]
MPRREVLFAGLFFGAGIIAASFINLSVYFGLLFVFLGAVLFFLRFAKIFSNKNFVLLAVMALLFFGFGSFWYIFRLEKNENNSSVLNMKIGKNAVIEGIVDEEPQETENNTRLILKTKEDVKVLLIAQSYPVFRYGDKIEVRGVLQKPDNFFTASGISGQSFDWRAYLAKDDIFFEMIYPKTKLISSGNGSKIKGLLFSVKEKFLRSVSSLLPEPHASLLGGLTVGAKKSMPKKLLDDFKKAGVIHIVVLSGYNVTLVADAAMRVFSFLPSFLSIGFGAFAILLFTLMTGASVPVVRASFMALLVLVARATGRLYHISTALLFAGFFMILGNPKILRFDTSFQLSFLATISLIYLAPALAKKLTFLPKKFQIREIAASALATQIFVLPLLLYRTGIFSTVGLPVNLLILMFVPITMFVGFLAGGVGLLSFYLAAPFSWLAWILLEYELAVVAFFNRLPFASYTIAFFPLWLAFAVYGFYVLLLYKLRKNFTITNAKN